jgi:hypothetical protein
VVGTRNLGGVTTFVRAAQEATGRRCDVVDPAVEHFDADAIAARLESATASGRDTTIVRLGVEALIEHGLDATLPVPDVVVVTSLERDGATDEDLRRRAARLIRRMRPDGIVVLPSDEKDASPLAASNLDVTVRFAGFTGSADLAGRVETTGVGAGRDICWTEDETCVRRVRVRVAGARCDRAVLLAAAATPTLTEAGAEAVAAALGRIERVTGQLEPITEGQAFAVVSEGAPGSGDLEDAVREARGLTSGGRLLGLIAVDAASPLGTLERTLADLDLAILAPADNLPPRVRAWLASMADDAIVVEPDRSQAIERILDQAGPGDAVLIVTSNPVRQTTLERRPALRADPRPAQVARRPRAGVLVRQTIG